MKYDIEIIKKVVGDFKNGKNKSQLSKEYNIPRATLKYWIQNESTIKVKRTSEKSIEDIIDEIKSKKSLYNFILGLYLGDGNISHNGRKLSSFRLRISQDNKYPESIKEIQKSLSQFFVKNSFITKSEGCSILTIFDKNLPVYFPQHGLGKKHERKIELSDFQRENIDYESLLRGLWVSDGSFYMASDGKYSYERYNFTNKSLDIISLFEECLISLDIKYGKRFKKNDICVIQIQKKSEVDKMKKVVGIKS
jgi:hypothetical protein